LADRAFVTGATGFLGRSLVQRLAADGVQVVALSRIARDAGGGIEWVQGDVENAERMAQVVRDVDVVFHAGGMVGHYGSRDAYLKANVGGTKNVIAACRANGVKSLVFTSTPSVIADGTPHYGVDETFPYSTKFQSPYSESKALAEQIARGASGAELRTVSIRPHMIWGSGPSHWVGGMRKLARKGRLYQVGPGTNRVGMTYMDDCVSAHVAAWRAVEADSAVGGQAFFVHGGSPIALWGWVRQLTEALGLPGIQGTIPVPAAAAAASVCDALARISGGSLHFPISRYLITELTTDHYSSIGRARAYLGYEPRVTVEEGIARIAAAEPEVAATQPRGAEPSPI
jgi:nucleoside-diphosphate-sugar epimerase